ncbi:MAG: type III-A CRISPR-associated RAMP protein Csm4 [SAR324 cluster bacterium]|nr:type III-A CRISPR-associated RAMP protein Csm4 [SAR324 cluster bacterium]
MWKVQLNFGSTPVHIGLDGIGQEKLDQTFHSDAVFGALASVWALVYPEDICDAFFQNPPFRVTSCFPVMNNIEFFPMPIGLLDKYLEHQPDLVKPLKKILWISRPLFEVCLRKGENLVSDPLFQQALIHIPHNREYLHIKYLSSQSKIIASEVPRLFIDRQGRQAEEGHIWYFTKLYFKEASWFFLIHFETSTTEKQKKRLETIIHLLGDTGIGADRSVGHGLFTPNIDKQYKLSEAASPREYLHLSLTLPAPDDLQPSLVSSSRYSLTMRKGAVTFPGKGNMRKNPVRMFTAGSCFSYRLKGQTVPVLTLNEGQSDETRIYRYGHSFQLGMGENI